MQHRDKIIFQKIISEADICAAMISGLSEAEFLQNEMLKRAVGMTLINIGELVKNVTDETRLANKEIPWKSIAGMRDLTAHKYQTLRMEDVYNTAVNDIPVFRNQLQTLINEDETEEESVGYGDYTEERKHMPEMNKSIDEVCKMKPDF